MSLSTLEPFVLILVILVIETRNPEGEGAIAKKKKNLKPQCYFRNRGIIGSATVAIECQ